MHADDVIAELGIAEAVEVALVGKSRGHKLGDVIEVSPAEAERLIAARLAKRA